ncbi:MAG: hypothetical protein H0Z34_15790 [Brevibacillus sp.]|nr:hypothetical protein [Brevibacillus sp.]
MGDSSFIRFRFRSAFFFLAFVVAANLIFTPLLTLIGLTKQVSLFILNSLSGGIGVTIVFLYFEGKYRNRTHAWKFFAGSLVVCTLASYYLVFLF